jgi:protoporphyrinogen oxidase
LAGLAAATQCAKSGVPFLLLEGSDEVGGRVRTDSYQGFLLDRGFQIFITAYPEAQAVLNYETLDLQTFYAGALVWYNGTFHRVADPIRHFADGVGSLYNPIGSIRDKITVGTIRVRAAVKPLADILTSEETTILSRLRSEGLSEAMIDRFFRPFFGGIFFDRELQTTSRLFEFVFKCLALGSNTLPGAGIGAIPQQLAANLPKGSLLLDSRVAKLVENGVILENGRLIKADYGVVIAVEGPEAARLLGQKLPSSASVEKPFRSTTCLYFSADSSPIKEPILLLNGSKSGIINNMFFPTTVAPSYAPPGKTLVSVSLIGQYESTSDAELEETVRRELRSYFGAEVVESWQHLRTYRIPLAQPDQVPPTQLQKEPRVEPRVYVCGDHRYSSTFDGALVSGRRAVQALMADCKLTRSK